MRITYDAAKRQRTLKERGLDFEDAASVFEGLSVTRLDERRDYGEARWITIGLLRGSIVVVVWTERSDARRVISLRKAHDHERRDYQERVGRSG